VYKYTRFNEGNELLVDIEEGGVKNATVMK